MNKYHMSFTTFTFIPDTSFHIHQSYHISLAISQTKKPEVLEFLRRFTTEESPKDYA